MLATDLYVAPPRRFGSVHSSGYDPLLFHNMDGQSIILKKTRFAADAIDPLGGGQSSRMWSKLTGGRDSTLALVNGQIISQAGDAVVPGLSGFSKLFKPQFDLTVELSVPAAPNTVGEYGFGFGWTFPDVGTAWTSFGIYAAAASPDTKLYRLTGADFTAVTTATEMQHDTRSTGGSVWFRFVGIYPLLYRYVSFNGVSWFRDTTVSGFPGEDALVKVFAWQLAFIEDFPLCLKTEIHRRPVRGTYDIPVGA